MSGPGATAAALTSLVLASASPRRRELLTALGLPFVVAAADLDESLLPGEDPAAAAVRLAWDKAAAVVHRLTAPSLVVAADTVVILAGRGLAKPADAAEARAMLAALRGRAHTVVTGLAVLDAPAGTVLTDAPATEVRMRAYAGAEVEASIAAGTPFDKAGGYAIQDEAFAPVAAIAGCYCNVVGLPLWSLRALLARLRPALVLDRPDRTRPVCTGCPLRGPDA